MYSKDALETAVVESSKPQLEGFTENELVASAMAAGDVLLRTRPTTTRKRTRAADD
jgi:hypothetical protein